MDPASLFVIAAVGGAFALLGGGAATVGGALAFQVLKTRAAGRRVPRRKTKVAGPLPKVDRNRWVDFDEIVFALGRLEDEWCRRFSERSPAGTPMGTVEVRRTVRRALDSLLIRFVPGDSFKGKGKARYRGRLYPSPFGNLAKVAARDGVALGGTTFFHECIHGILLFMPPHFDADADHEGTRWRGWTEEVTELERYLNEEFSELVVGPPIDDKLKPHAVTCASCDQN